MCIAGPTDDRGGPSEPGQRRDGVVDAVAGAKSDRSQMTFMFQIPKSSLFIFTV
eukprot:m.31090 g.31090  ORF g.31090 m.31090 type:complete len:54 (+) comp12280_c0_seq1:669-830(+)